MSDKLPDKRLVFLTNKQAETIKPADCKWVLPHAITGATNEKMYIGLKNLTVPISWHVINVLNNTLSFTAADGTNTTITLEEADFSTATLVAELNELTDALDISFALNSNSGKLTITSSEGAILGGTIMQTLGFNTTSETFPAGGQLAAERMDLTAGLHAVYISTDLTTHNIDTRGTGGTACLTSIPITSSYGELLAYQTTDPIMFKTDNNFLNQIEIRL